MLITDKTSQSGLTSAEVAARRQQFGENRLPVEKTTSVWAILLNQVKSPLVYIILAAALVSLFAREYGDFAIIMAVVVIDVILGFVQEYQAHKTYTALKGLLKPTTTVIRDGERREVEVWELVPGDLVLLNAGEKVPGDGRLLESIKLAVDEAILTGESEPVSKGIEDQTFMGTTVLTGRGLMEVQQTGPATELGKIATSLQEHVEEDTPLQVRLKAFSKTLTWIVTGFTLAILVTGLLLGRGFLDMLRTSIILAIAAVPEGLLIAVTVILVLGMRKILKRNGLVKRLLAVETLGSVTTICTDKTGTLTEGRMRVSKTEILDPERALQTMVLCNDLEGPVDIAMWEHARQVMNGDPPADGRGLRRVGGRAIQQRNQVHDHCNHGQSVPGPGLQLPERCAGDRAGYVQDLRRREGTFPDAGGPVGWGGFTHDRPGLPSARQAGGLQRLHLGGIGGDGRPGARRGGRGSPGGS